MKRLITILFIISASVCLAECCCCCCEDGGGGSEGGGEGSGDSCVQMSPSECQQLKDNLSSTVQAARQTLDSYETSVIGQIESLSYLMANDVIQNLDDASLELNKLQTTNSSLNSAISSSLQSLASSKSRLVTAKSAWSSVGAGALQVSNLLSGTSTFLPRGQNPITVFSGCISSLEDTSSYLQSAQSLSSQESELISSAVTKINLASTSAETASQNLETLQRDATQVHTSLTSEIDSIESYSGSINCAACSSSGGGGAGGGGTVDLTPLLLAINNLNTSIQDQFTTLFQLINKYFTDYNNVSSWHVSSSPTYSQYSSSDNWFQRMEMLLFAASGLTVDQDDSDDPDTSELTSFQDSVDDNISQSSSDMQEHFSEQGKFRMIYDKLSQIFDKFQYLGNGSADINTPFFTDNVTIGNFDFGNVSVPSEVSSRLSQIFTMVRYAFQAFYMVFFAFVLFFLIMWTYQEGKDIFMSAMQIYASLFGGGS